MASEGMVITGVCVLLNCLWEQNAVKGLEYPVLGTQPQGKRGPWTTWSLISHPLDQIILSAE